MRTQEVTVLSKRGLVRLAELHDGNFVAPEIDDETATALASERDVSDEVSIEVRGARASVEWPLDGWSADEVTAALMGRLFVVRAESEDHAREAGGAMLLPFELIPDETVASVDDGLLRVSGPIAKG
jgi:hypothetical protein